LSTKKLHPIGNCLSCGINGGGSGVGGGRMFTPSGTGEKFVKINDLNNK